MMDQANRFSTGSCGAAPQFSVVIPHFEQPDWLERTLESLRAQQGAPDFEVIVVDNGSSELPTAVCDRFPEVRLLLETTKGPGPARNRGALEARAPVILFIDSDCVAAPDWMAIIDRRIRSMPETGIFCGDVSILPNDPDAMSAIECYEELFSYRPELMIRRFRFAPTCNLAVRTEVFRAVGPFIPGLLISEDVDWGRRATAAGHEIAFIPEMRIATPARETFAELFRRWDRQVGQQHAEMMQAPFGRLRWALKTFAMPFSPLAEVPGVFTSPRLPGFAERWRAFHCLVRTRLWRTGRMVQLMIGAIDAEWLAGAWRRTPGA